MGQVVDAVEYYKEFVQLAPNDNSKYILLYKIYEAQDISLEERIAVLKEYKKREYNEKWAYELAFLYHRVGLATECVEECDQLILWFGEGKYVAKAMELKMLYVPLSPAQQQAYDRYLGKREGREPEKREEKDRPAVSDQKAEAERPAKAETPSAGRGDGDPDKAHGHGPVQYDESAGGSGESMKEVLGPEEGKEKQATKMPEDPEMQEVPGSVTKTIETDRIREAAQAVRSAAQPEESPSDSAVLPDSGIDSRVSRAAGADAASASAAAGAAQAAVQEPVSGASAPAPKAAAPESERTESRPGERRITGQMSLEEVLAEWEKLRRDNEEKRKQETRQWMMQQTGTLFEDFDHTARDGVLEKLERGRVPAFGTGNRKTNRRYGLLRFPGRGGRAGGDRGAGGRDGRRVQCDPHARTPCGGRAAGTGA